MILILKENKIIYSLFLSNFEITSNVLLLFKFDALDKIYDSKNFKIKNKKYFIFLQHLNSNLWTSAMPYFPILQWQCRFLWSPKRK